MKRSEAQKAIVDTLRAMRMAEPDYSDENIAKHILLTLETEGMQPPAIKEPCETFVLHNGQYIKTEDSFIFTHKWDAE